MKSIALCAGIALLSCGAHAGTRYELKCVNEGCGYKDSIGLGGGFKFEQASGWCAKCGRMVSLTWERGSRKSPPRVEFWDPLSGLLRALFKCPKCDGFFVETTAIDALKHCPKCGKATLKATRRMMYD